MNIPLIPGLNTAHTPSAPSRNSHGDRHLGMGAKHRGSESTGGQERCVPIGINKDVEASRFPHLYYMVLYR